MAINNILPDPDNGRTAAGEYDAAGNRGPGFASVVVTSEQPVMQDRTNGGQLVRRFNAYQKWKIDITYNPMTREEFDPVYAFLLERQYSLEPFFVKLPQFSGTDEEILEDASAGEQQLLIDKPTNAFKPGDLFYVIDPDKEDHTKAYKITHYETYGALSSRPSSEETASDPDSDDDQARITFIPGLQESITAGSTKKAAFSVPQIQVIAPNNAISYTIDKHGLYKFSLKLEEACY